MNEIQSTKNTYIKELRKLHQKKQREKEQKYLIEGFHLVEEAYLAGVTIQDNLMSQRGLREWGDWFTARDLPVTVVSDEVMASLSDLPTPQGILAVVNRVAQPTPMTLQGKWLLLDGVQDPGNVGTMIRTADAAGFTGVFLGQGSADSYSSKVLRSMQGSQFHLQIHTGEIQEICQAFQAQGIPVYGTELNEQAVPYQTVNKTENVALVLGNEGQGVSAEVLAITDQNLYIPIYGQAESLNVAVAAGIIMYHFS